MARRQVSFFGQCRHNALHIGQRDTYGFYVQRDKKGSTARIESVAEGRLTEVIWGNHEIIELFGQRRAAVKLADVQASQGVN